ncbi:hypothetical protein JH25_00230 [Pseudomonas sp. BRG-100]|uniref:hypothetical protein n=1 Tax=Pseudomonas sp. BRG-100 TaxID=1524267 RepID=UPI0004E6ACD5|nr:hypothetical protein [Pseudomonas sp. BRG-100]KFF42252.1 hypothetical protein JH25_00230 [Pseudomonas sp. BRG-100]
MSIFEEDEKTSSHTLVIWAVVLLVLAGIGWGIWTMLQKDTLDKVTLCPSKGPVAQYVVLIDNTSPFSFNEKAALSQRIKSLVINDLPVGALISVFLLDEDYKQHDTPLFERCKPTQWKDDMKYLSSKRLVEKDYADKFDKPLDVVMQHISLDEKAKTSPIFEMLQLVGIKAFEHSNVQGDKQLIIFSDMVANEASFSMYRSTLPSYKEFANTPYGRKSTAMTLQDVKVTINMLTAEPSAAPYGKRSDFWAHYFEANQAKLESVNPMEGL